MKKNSLTTAVVAGIAGIAGFAGLAQAVDLNPDGLGQVLIYPYYTVQGNQDTMFSVVNTSDVGKAVKVRFLEGYNSREVLDFNLFLSPFDVWTGVVTNNGSETGPGVLRTADKSCTTPAIPAAGVAFRNLEFSGSTADGGPTSLSRTREGYIELISMGDIVAGSPLDRATTHVQTGVPNAGKPPCGSAISGNNPAANLVPPTGGLFGSGMIADVGMGYFYGYNADAVDGFTNSVIWSDSGALNPSLQQADFAGPGAPAGTAATAYVFNDGRLITLNYAEGIDAVSAVFTADNIFNEYLSGGVFAAQTDWVVTFPTKRFYVDSGTYGMAAAIPPFAELFSETNDGQSNVVIDINIFDQEEGAPDVSVGDDFSPVPPGAPPSSLSYEVNVISFMDPADIADPADFTSGVFGSELVRNIAPYGDSGWLWLGLADGDGGHALRPSLEGGVVHGLPVTGFEAFNVINSNAAPGVLANYGAVFRHRASRTCTNAGTADGACS